MNQLDLEFLRMMQDVDLLQQDADQAIDDYYQKIANVLQGIPTRPISKSPTDRYYIYKKKPFVFNGETYYELTISSVSNSTRKSDRIIAFSKLNVPHYYAVHLEFQRSQIEIVGHAMDLAVIVAFCVSVRPCEFDNFNRLFGHVTNVSTRDAEYKSLMSYLSKTGANLTEFLSMSNQQFDAVQNNICQGVKSTPIFLGLQKCRKYVGKPGSNVLTYLLYRLNNLVLRDQYDPRPNDKLSNLYLQYGCIPFDVMPFANDLYRHTTRLYDLMHCIDSTNRQHELLGRYIKHNTEVNAKLYTPVYELQKFQNIEELIERYNECIYSGHRQSACLCLEDGYVFIKGYESNTVNIISQLIDMTKSGVEGYGELVENWLGDSGYTIDSPEKKRLIKKMFSKTQVALIYGSAGTGKSTMIKHLSSLFADKNILYLANTHTAVDNLRRIINGEPDQFKTVKKCINNGATYCDVLIIDECSTISNADMVAILDNVYFDLLVLVGDIYQIESIKFGNWFAIAKEFIPKSAICELTYVHRSSNSHLKNLWNSVRNLDGDMQDLLESYDHCSPMSESIFEKTIGEDEVVLCLNYDGLYGINNINQFLQDGQQGKMVEYGLERYRVGDPIIFVETERFGELLYNNLKGVILDIQEEPNQIKFTIEVDKYLYDCDVEEYSLNLEAPIHSNKSVVSFYVGKFVNQDDDDVSAGDVIPFKIAHALSIHKAQGLEYDSVKLVITDEVGELISHNIFYTAITRAKHKLKIYWSAKTEKKILENMHFTFNNDDATILNQKFKLKRRK